jgi:hypothetical protein
LIFNELDQDDISEEYSEENYTEEEKLDIVD